MTVPQLVSLFTVSVLFNNTNVLQSNGNNSAYQALLLGMLLHAVSHNVDVGRQRHMYLREIFFCAQSTILNAVLLKMVFKENESEIHSGVINRCTLSVVNEQCTEWQSSEFPQTSSLSEAVHLVVCDPAIDGKVVDLSLGGFYFHLGREP